MEKSGLIIGCHDALFLVLGVKRSNHKIWARGIVFVGILGFIFYDVSRAKTDFHIKYLI